MNLLRYILPSTTILIINYQNEYDCEYKIITTENKVYGSAIKDETVVAKLDDIKNKLTHNPVIVYLSGYGVINKNIKESPQIIAKVTSNIDEFLHTYSGSNSLWFVRRSQIEKEINRLKKQSAKVICVRCGTITRHGERFEDDDLRELIKQEITPREILKPSTKGSMLTTMICRKIQLPILIFTLIVLIINFNVGQKIREEYSINLPELRSLQKQIGKQTEISESMKKLATEFYNRMPYKYSWVSDRIGALLPSGIILSQISIQPLTKPLEPNKKPIITEKQIKIEGNTDSAEAVSIYLQSLQNEKFSKNLRLSSIEQNAETKLFHFKIEMQL